MLLRSRSLALLAVLGLAISVCGTSVNQAPTDQPGSKSQAAPTGSGSSGSSLGVPLAAADPEAFRLAEAALRRDGRAKAGLAQLGPGALKLADLMDQTASFALSQLRGKLRVQVPGGLVARPGESLGSGGRLAAPLAGMPQPGEAVLGAYLITTQAFDGAVEIGDSDRRAGSKGVHDCPCTATVLAGPEVDTVTVDGNPGLITTTMTATVTASGSKVSIDLTIRVAGQVSDGSGAILYKIANEGTGHADGDGCPDASGTAHAHMLFGGHEDYFDAHGTKTSTGVSESFGGELRIRVDDNAKIAGVDIIPVGKGGEFMMRLAAQSAAPVFENVWRSGVCIALLVSPDGGAVDKDSDTTVTVKVKHTQDGNELDKLVEAKLTGAKSVEPTTKQKAPATFHYLAGSKDGDKGNINFESVSNRGIGRLSSTFSISGDWSVSSVGTSVETVAETGSVTSVRISFTDVKVTRTKDFLDTGKGLLSQVVHGSGQITIKGSLEAHFGDVSCSAPIDRTFAFELTGSVRGNVMKLKVSAPNPPGEGYRLTCDTATVDIPKSGEGDFYGHALGELELPADGGTATFDRSEVIALAAVHSTATVTVAQVKP
jgi:hypothetical protein